MIVVEPLEADRRPEVVPLAGVIEDDVEDDLDVVLVQLADEHLELVDLLRRTCRNSCSATRERRRRRCCIPMRWPALAGLGSRNGPSNWSNSMTGSNSTAVIPSSFK